MITQGDVRHDTWHNAYDAKKVRNEGIFQEVWWEQDAGGIES